MTLETNLRAAVTARLSPGEELQAAFPALRSAPWKLFGVDGGYNYIVAATNRRIVVFETTAVKLSTVRTVLFELPRNHRFGPPKGRLYARLQLGSLDAWVHRRFWDQLHAADAAAA